MFAVILLCRSRARWVRCSMASTSNQLVTFYAFKITSAVKRTVSSTHALKPNEVHLNGVSNSAHEIREMTKWCIAHRNLFGHELRVQCHPTDSEESAQFGDIRLGRTSQLGWYVSCYSMTAPSLSRLTTAVRWIVSVCIRIYFEYIKWK